MKALFEEWRLKTRINELVHLWDGNRAFFVEELNRLERKGPRPVTIVAADLNASRPQQSIGSCRRRRLIAAR